MHVVSPSLSLSLSLTHTHTHTHAHTPQWETPEMMYFKMLSPGPELWVFLFFLTCIFTLFVLLNKHTPFDYRKNIFIYFLKYNGLPWWLRRLSLCLQYGRPRFDPWVGKFPGEGNDNPLQFSCLENPMDGGAWCPWGHRVGHDWATSVSFFLWLRLSNCSFGLVCLSLCLNSIKLLLLLFSH